MAEANRSRTPLSATLSLDTRQREEAVALARKALAEALGTFALTFVAAGALVVGAASNGEVDHVGKTVAPGLLVMAFIYALGDVSGAHFNPAVTLAFAARRTFPVALVPLYWIAQFAGAVLAALFLNAAFGNVRELGATLPKLGVPQAFGFEVVLTWILVTVILGTADRARLVGPNAALAVGATIALCGLFASPVSDASMNPARSLGPALVSGHLADYWIYLAGPAIGALLAVGGMWLMHGDVEHDVKSRDAAQGDEKAGPRKRG